MSNNFEEARKQGLQEAIEVVQDLLELERRDDTETAELLLYLEHTFKSLKYGGSVSPWI